MRRIRDFGFGGAAAALTSGSSGKAQLYTNFKGNGEEICKKKRQPAGKASLPLCQPKVL